MSSKDYDNVNDAFEKAVNLLQDNLQYLVNSGKVSSRFIAMQNNIIKALINYQHQTENIISNLQWENHEIANRKVEEIERLRLVKESLEAVCIIHGIMDFPIWLSKGNALLVNQAISNSKENSIHLPSALKKRFEDLSEDEKLHLDKILYKEFYRKLEEEDRRIQQLKRRINDLTT